MVEIIDNEFEKLLKKAIIKELKSEINSTSSEEFYPSIGFQNQIKELFKKDNRKTYFKKFFFYTKRAAMLILVIMGILTTLFIFNEDVRARVENTIEWFDDHTRFQFAPDYTVKERKEFDLGIIPEEYEIVDIEDLKVVKIVSLKNSDGKIIHLTYGGTNVSESMSVDNEYHDFRVEYVNNYEIMLIVGNEIENRNFAIWEIEGIRFKLNGEIEVEDLMYLVEIIIKGK